MTNTVVFLWISASVAVSPAPLAALAARTDLGATAVSTASLAARTVSSAPLAAPTVLAEMTLRDYGAVRGVDFVPPAASARPLGLPANDAAIVDAIEGELEQARTALSALEEGAALSRLSRVEGQLVSHSYLPQASFLMAECLALQARAARERSPELARALESRRAELEGPRASAFGETSTATPSEALLTLPVEGLAERDVLEVDGVSLGAARRVELGAGLHHVRVLRRERVVFAAFTEVVAEQRALALAAPSLEPCSAEDLWGAPADVVCPRWAQVREEPGGIGVAWCERETCGTFVHWQRRSPAPFTPLHAERRGMPAWLGFAIAGAAVAAAGTLALWQSGAFDRSRPNAASWEYGGLNPQGLRF